MSILKTEKVIIAGLQSSQEHLLKRLQKEGLIHIETLKESKSQPELTLLRELEEAIKFLSLYEEKKSFFQKFQEVFSLNREDLYKERDFFEESDLVKKTLTLKKELLKIREERKNRERELSQIQDFLFFNFSLKDLEFKEVSWSILSEEKERVISLFIEYNSPSSVSQPKTSTLIWRDLALLTLFIHSPLFCGVRVFVLSVDITFSGLYLIVSSSYG